ncbi:hypothetical protein ACIHEI_35800 [Kitasatospora sp. NPDC051984]|uniref:hypothetical protein n=1 Tax=Kitasatospora sp. NPDC051984 TaxID=3364059 RepID=UPI0037CC472D
MLRTSRSRARKAAVAAACAVLPLGAALVAPAAASAAPAAVKVSCQAAGQVHFNPGVELLPRAQHVSYQGQEGACDDFSKFDIMTAKLTMSFDDVSLSCLASGSSGSGKGSAKIEWTEEDGETAESILDVQIDNSALNVGHVSGQVRSGQFKGHGFTGTFKTSLVAGGIECTIGAPGGGVKDADFTGDFSIS